MKVRKKVIGIFLVAVVLCLGVGFAALADELLVDGKVAVTTDNVKNQFDESIFFSTPTIAASTETGETGATVSAESTCTVTGTDKDTLSIDVKAGTFSAVGQVVVVTAKIENSSLTNDANVAVTAKKANSDAESTTDPSNLTVGSFAVTVELSDSTVVKNNGTDNGTITVTIKIELAKLPTADENNTFTFKLTATAA